jgi:hypothetical protein
LATDSHWRFSEGTRTVHRHICHQLTLYCFWMPVLTLQLSNTARQDHAVLCVAVLLQWISFLKNSYFHVQTCSNLRIFVSEHNYFTSTCHLLANLRTTFCNFAICLFQRKSYGGVINMLCSVDVPETKFLGKYLLNLCRAMWSTAHNLLWSTFYCSKFSTK